ncbi:alpha/beta hydrolase [Sulfurovum sp.]|uniref:RBBP9/YdeN family alpha/beta hydrolase n=1 Tax=Sulfurovum sp. TaxID=1969726 RepID=UPI002867E709|nr:alpha/beta hydrolase [Sulfurovum sp.]
MPTQDKVLILHGWGGSDTPHWQAELAATVAKNYGTVSFPLLDNCHFPSKNRWVKQLRGILQDFKPDTVVCHSLANTLWFWLCQEEIPEVKRLFMVSPPSLSTEIDIIKTFFPCALPKKLYAQKVQMIVSDNDPYIKAEEAETIAKQYNIPLTIVKNAGHINADSGYGKWEFIENLVRHTK